MIRGRPAGASRWRIALCAMVVAASCRKGPTWIVARGERCADGDTSAFSAALDAADSSALSGGEENLDRATRNIPGGFAAAFPENGQMVVLLVDPSKRDTALAALNGLAPIPPFDPQRATVRKARWTFAQLRAWQAYLTMQGGSSSVATVGINHAANRIEFGTVGENGRRELLRELESLDVPCDLAAVSVLGVWPRAATR